MGKALYRLWVIRQKFPFWFRHMCPSITSTVEARIETHLIRSKFDTVLGQKTLDKEWVRACLPTKTHGCGLGRPSDIIAAAFAANVEETLDAVKSKLPATSTYLELIHASAEDFDSFDFDTNDICTFVRNAREKKATVISAATELNETLLLEAYDAKPSDKKRKTQHFYSDFINRLRAKEMSLLIQDHGSDVEKATFLSTDGSLAGAFLFNIPKEWHSTMTNQEFRIALKLRLGVQFHDLLPHCCCPQRTPICPNGIHLFSCNEFKPYMLTRHNAIVKVIKDLAHHGGKRALDSGLGRLIAEDGRQGDLWIAGMGKDHSDLVLDVTIGNAPSPAYIHHSRDIANYTLSLLEKNKFDKYAAPYRNVGVEFKPLAMEMHGATSDIFMKFLRELASAAAEVNDIPYCITFSYWQRRVSTTLQKYNANVFHNALNKIARVTGLMNNGDKDLNDTILNDRHIHSPLS